MNFLILIKKWIQCRLKQSKNKLKAEIPVNFISWIAFLAIFKANFKNFCKILSVWLGKSNHSGLIKNAIIKANLLKNKANNLKAFKFHLRAQFGHSAFCNCLIYFIKRQLLRSKQPISLFKFRNAKLMK